MTVLALEFRPITFSDVVGQRHIKPILRAMVRSENVPPALLFAGTRGTGKTTTARILAAALNCESRVDGDACSECPSCRAVQSGTSLSVLEVDAASHGLVDDVRKLKEMVGYDVAGLWRVVMLDEAHSMSRAAFNALLKVLEEPPARTTFVLLTTEAARIPETIVSRSMAFDFRRLTIEDIRGRLEVIAEAKGIDVDPALVTEIAIRAQGGMRDAVMTLDQCSRVDIRDVDGFHDLFGIQDVAVPVFKAALTGDYAEGARIIDEYFHRVGDAQGMVTDLVMLVRDLIVICSGGSPTVGSEASLAARRELAGDVDVGLLVRVTQVLWDLKGRTRAVDNDHRSSMEMAFVLVADALRPSEAAGPILRAVGTSATVDEPLSMDKLRAIAESYRERGNGGHTEQRVGASVRAS
jgi:DNA polymerase-3 subunit gamma/tau